MQNSRDVLEKNVFVRQIFHTCRLAWWKITPATVRLADSPSAPHEITANYLTPFAFCNVHKRTRAAEASRIYALQLKVAVVFFLLLFYNKLPPFFV